MTTESELAPVYTGFPIRRVKATRKPWVCVQCGREWEAGTPCTVHAHLMEGVFYADRMCPQACRMMEE